MAAAPEDPALALNADGSARDPEAFRATLRGDPSKLAALEADPELRDALLSGDVADMQALLQAAYKVRGGGGGVAAGSARHRCSRRATRAFALPHRPPPTRPAALHTPALSSSWTRPPTWGAGWRSAR